VNGRDELSAAMSPTFRPWSLGRLYDITIVGRVPLSAGEQSLAFRIETAITQEDRRIDRLRRMDEVRQRQLLTIAIQDRSTSLPGHAS
jgi:hypothetical protein